MKTQMSLIIFVVFSLSRAAAQEGQCLDANCKEQTENTKLDVVPVNALQVEKKDTLATDQLPVGTVLTFNDGDTATTIDEDSADGFALRVQTPAPAPPIFASDIQCMWGANKIMGYNPTGSNNVKLWRSSTVWPSEYITTETCSEHDDACHATVCEQLCTLNCKHNAGYCVQPSLHNNGWTCKYWSILRPTGDAADDAAVQPDGSIGQTRTSTRRRGSCGTYSACEDCVPSWLQPKPGNTVYGPLSNPMYRDGQEWDGDGMAWSACADASACPTGCPNTPTPGNDGPLCPDGSR